MSWHGNTFYISGPLWGESNSRWWIPHAKRQHWLIDDNIDVVFVVYKLLNKQWSFQWLEMPWCSSDFSEMIALLKLLLVDCQVRNMLLVNSNFKRIMLVTPTSGSWSLILNKFCPWNIYIQATYCTMISLLPISHNRCRHLYMNPITLYTLHQMSLAVQQDHPGWG